MNVKTFFCFLIGWGAIVGAEVAPAKKALLTGQPKTSQVKVEPKPKPLPPVDESLVTDERELDYRDIYFSSHPGAYYMPVNISALGERVYLHDSSVWMMSQNRADRDRVKQWMTADPIVIAASQSWFSSYDFVLINTSNGDRIESNWCEPPLYGGRDDHWIESIDYENNKLRLNDGTVWELSRFDHARLQEWLQTDTVMIGICESWFVSYNPNILINLRLGNYIKGKCKE